MVEDIVEPRHRRVEIRTGAGGRRRWTDVAKGRIVTEAVAPGAVTAEVARRYEATPQHLFSWIRATRGGYFALQVADALAFVLVVSAESVQNRAQLRLHP